MIDLKQAIQFIETAKLDQTKEGEKLLTDMRNLEVVLDTAKAEYYAAKEGYDRAYKAAGKMVEAWLETR
jgi:hypothetical protein